MIEIRETEYLLRPLIEGAAFTIEDEHVRITSPSTIYAEAYRSVPVHKDELLSLYKRVLRKAKAQGVKISYTRHIRKQISEHWDEYESRCAEACTLFSKIIDQARVVRARGIHYGTCNDAELDKLGALCSEYQKYFWRNSIVSHISAIRHDLMQIENDLSRAHCHITQISL